MPHSFLNIVSAIFTTKQITEAYTVHTITILVSQNKNILLCFTIVRSFILNFFQIWEAKLGNVVELICYARDVLRIMPYYS